MKRFDFPFGSLVLMDGFPTTVEKFSEFPSGRLIVGQIDGGELIHYQLNLVPPQERRVTAVTNIMAKLTAVIEGYVYEVYGDKPVHGYKSLQRILEWLINPASIRHTQGTVQLIHGVSSGGGGFTNFELYFPRGIFFRMAGMYEGSELFPTKPGIFTGSVVFANRPYRFYLRADYANWNPYPPRSLPTVFTTIEQIDEKEKWEAQQNTIPKAMSKEAAEAEIRRYMYRSFPFIEEYNMLGEFTFD